MSKTNTENTIPEMQAPETAGGLPLDVRVRPIAPMGNLLAFASRLTASVSVPAKRGCM